MRTIHTFCPFHLGDGFCVAHLLRNLAILHPNHEFIHATNPDYLPELEPFSEGAPNLKFVNIREVGERGTNTWKNAEGFWESHPLKWNYAAFTKRYYRRLTRKLGFTDSIPALEFDLPCLKSFFSHPPKWDVLVVNSNPQSGQFLSYTDEDSMDPMVRALIDNGKKVITTKSVDGVNCTRDWNHTCAEVGELSNTIPWIVGVATGPLWLCLNKWNTSRRIILCEKETVKFRPEDICVRTIAEAMDKLKEVGLIV